MIASADAQFECVVSNGVSWTKYEQLMANRGSNTLPRFNFYEGALETLSPGPKHAKQVRRLASLVETVTEMWEIDAENLASTTFKREDIACGFEPDCCFYMENLDDIEDPDEINLESGDPPPDLVLDIFPAGVPMPKLPLYAKIGIPEVWQVDGTGLLRIFVRQGAELVENPISAAFYKITAVDLNNLLEFGEAASPVQWLKRVREWVFNL